MMRRKKTPATETDKQAKTKSFIKSEWPLFLYPALVIAAIALLQLVNRSMEKDLSPSQGPGQRGVSPNSGPAEPDGSRPLEATSAQDGSTLPLDTFVQSPEAAPAPGEESMADRLRTIEAMRRRAEAAAAAGGALGGGPAQELDGVDAIVANLRQALRAQDHSRIKQAMSELVALGDEVVGPLSEIVASGKDETAVWAAEALARIGTPTATAALFDTLSMIKDGTYKEQIAKTASNITNHDSWPLLLDTLQDTKDVTVQRAAGASLSRMADTPVVDEIIARYDAALTEEEAARLAQLVSNISSPGAGESLRTLAGEVSSAPVDGLQQAAIDALANVGDAQSVNYLLSRLEASPPGEGGALFDTISHISVAQAHSSLLYAAAGNKAVSAEQGRTAAIYALENYPSAETCSLLEQIVATEDNAAVVSAALRTLENIQKAVPSAVEKATSKADPGIILPLDPLQK